MQVFISHESYEIPSSAFGAFLYGYHRFVESGEGMYQKLEGYITVYTQFTQYSSFANPGPCLWGSRARAGVCHMS